MFIICSLLFAFYRCVSFYFTFLSHSYPFCIITRHKGTTSCNNKDGLQGVFKTI